MATIDRWLLPDGIEEVLPPQAQHIETARRATLDLLQRWGYELVITPHIEFIESLLVNAGQDLDLKTFKMLDPLSGRQMGVRADITPQVARIDAHALRQTGPARLCYAGSVLHAKPQALSSSRSLIQLGAELYGDYSSTADLEIISLMLEVLNLAAVADVHLDLGHVGIYRGLAQAAGLSGCIEQQLFDALQRKATDEVAALTESLPPDLAHMLRSLVRLCGGAEVLDEAKQLLAMAPEPVQSCLTTLRQVATQLSLRYPEVPLYFDLGELRGYHYHTGILFAAFVPGVGQSIAQGGRYDHIGAPFGRARAATGFSTDLKNLIALGQLESVQAHPAIWAPSEASTDLWQQISALRQAGERVIQALDGQNLESAQQLGCDRQLVLQQNDWIVVPLP